MKPIDRHYLNMQFKVKIFSKCGTEFQTFFESIMEKRYENFQKIRPYGKEGDGGNDGYIKELGRYYQVYAPNTPKIKEPEAAKKFINDFHKLKNNWDTISEIKEYFFVFNDNYEGSTTHLESAITDLEKDNPDISFNTFLAKNLERDFVKLTEIDYLDLGFNLDSRDIIDSANNYLEVIRSEIERDSIKNALYLLEQGKDLFSKQIKEDLDIEYGLLVATCLVQDEKVDEALALYETMAKRHPDDPRPLLKQAGIFLTQANSEKNLEYLTKARKIDSEHWMLRLQHLYRSLHINEEVSCEAALTDSSGWSDRIESNFNRICSLLSEQQGKSDAADIYIEKAIECDPNSLNNYVVRLYLKQTRIFSDIDNQDIEASIYQILEDLDSTSALFNSFKSITKRTRAQISVIRFNCYLVLQNIPSAIKEAEEAVPLLLQCNFNVQIDRLLSDFLRNISLPKVIFEQVTDYLEASSCEMSEYLVNTIVYQFLNNGELATSGRSFFKKKGHQLIVELIDCMEKDDVETSMALLGAHDDLALCLAYHCKSSALRRAIIDSLPNDQKHLKSKMLILLNYDEENIDGAYSFVKELDFNQVRFVECEILLDIVRKKEAWDLEIILLEKMLEYEDDDENCFKLKLYLFNAHQSLKSFIISKDIGEGLLKENSQKKYLNLHNFETLLYHTIFANLERGKVDAGCNKKCLELLEKYRVNDLSYKFKTNVIPEIYLKNEDCDSAFSVIEEAISEREFMSPEDWANLYFLVSIRICQVKNISLDSLEVIGEDSYIKLQEKDRWLFLGQEKPIDAVHIESDNPQYTQILGCARGESYIVEEKYSSKTEKCTIEIIYSRQQYVLSRILFYFNQLLADGSLPYVTPIEFPSTDEEIDPKYLIQFFNDQEKVRQPFFDLFCKQPVPLAMLAKNEGSLTSAIAKIQGEERGFINCSDGTEAERRAQEETCKDIIEGKLPLYLDATSALVLTEFGLLNKVHRHLPNLRVPQSVVNFLTELSQRFLYSINQYGYLGFTKGKIRFSSIEEERSNRIYRNFQLGIKSLEGRIENVKVISLANKVDCFSEQEVPAEVCDACILAQADQVPVLTDDFRYLQMNCLQTEKEMPRYFSSITLVRVLYEMDLLTFQEYIECFGYLSSYRYRLLPLTSDDIEKTIFGTGRVSVINISNVGHLNLKLTLSEEYGVSWQTALSVIGHFLKNIITDDSIEPRIFQRIFIELFDYIPDNLEAQTTGKMLMDICQKHIESRKSDIIVCPVSDIKKEKIKLLQEAVAAIRSTDSQWCAVGG